MTTKLRIKSCIKCSDNSDVSICNGCDQSYCEEHLFEHLEDLVKQMDEIDEECQVFRESLIEENDPAEVLSAIDNWEKESIEKIHLVAQNARSQVENLTKQLIEDFNQSIDKIRKDIESNRLTNDLNEIHLNKWNEQLQTLKHLLEDPFPIILTIDDTRAEQMNFIKVEYESPFLTPSPTPTPPPPPPPALELELNRAESPVLVKNTPRSLPKHHITKLSDERFDRIAGYALLSNNSLVATFTGYSSITGLKSYRNGIHHIRFRIINKKNDGLFFGILPSKQKLTARASELSTASGWRDFDWTIINGIAQVKPYKNKNYQPNDYITLTIDCDHHKISLIHHHQRNRMGQLNIDIHKTPLPWKLLVSSYGDDVISIIHSLDAL